MNVPLFPRSARGLITHESTGRLTGRVRSCVRAHHAPVAGLSGQIPERPSFPDVTGGSMKRSLRSRYRSAELARLRSTISKRSSMCAGRTAPVFSATFLDRANLCRRRRRLAGQRAQPEHDGMALGPSAATIEEVVVGWRRKPSAARDFAGSLTGGGSPANLMALAMARESRLPANEDGARAGTVYASEQAHMSIPKAVALLGIGHKNLRLVPCDDRSDSRRRIAQEHYRRRCCRTRARTLPSPSPSSFTMSRASRIGVAIIAKTPWRDRFSLPCRWMRSPTACTSRLSRRRGTPQAAASARWAAPSAY